MSNRNQQRIESTSERRRMYIGPATDPTKVAVHWYRGSSETESGVQAQFEFFDNAELVEAINMLDDVTATYEKPFTLPKGIGAVIKNRVNAYVRTADNLWTVSRHSSQPGHFFTDAEMLQFKHWEIVSEGVVL